MPRSTRMLIPDEATVYHVISRTALDGFPFGDIEKDKFVSILKRFSRLYFVEVFGYTILDNHFHLLIKMIPGHTYTDEDIRQRFIAYHGDDTNFPVGNIDGLRGKYSSLSEFVKDIKQTFSRYYNKLHNRRGTLWGERFKSVIVQQGETVINCLAYIDLNSVRAGIVKRPDDYRWSSIGYHVQTGNKDEFLSLDFGLVEFGVLDAGERFRRYRRYVYEAGSIIRSDGKSQKVINSKHIEKERHNNFEITRTERFMHKTRYFTDSGIIGTKEFVAVNYQRFKHMFQAKHEKKPKPVAGFAGIYSLKRLSS